MTDEQKQNPKPTMEQALKNRLRFDKQLKKIETAKNMTPKEGKAFKESAVTLRPEQVPEQQSHDEIVEQALGDASAEMANQAPPEDQFPPIKSSEVVANQIQKATEQRCRTMETTLNQPEMVTQETPASNTDPQPATESSTPESPGPILTINTDVAMERNPGPAAIAIVVRDELGVIETISRKVGTRTNNEGEYLGVIEALRYALAKKASAVLVQSDSELIVKQINKDYQVRDSVLTGLSQKVARLIESIPGKVEVRYVPREQNKEADKLAGELIRPKAPRTERDLEIMKEEIANMEIIPVESGLLKLLQFVHGGAYNVSWVQLHITSISCYPKVMPSPTLWDIPRGIDIAELVYAAAVTPGYVQSTWPYLRLLLGSSRDNEDWAASVYTTLVLFDTVKVLPFATK